MQFVQKLGVCALVLSGLLGSISAANVGTSTSLRRQRKAAFSADPQTLIEPLKFNQKLLICNAYPHKSRTTATMNQGKKVISEGGLKFNECEYALSEILPHDKLDFAIADAGIEGTFEIGSLPDSDAVLLLVIEKRDGKSAMFSFNSFAFPTSAMSGDEAQVAVIDAYKGETKMPHLKMSDHMSGTANAQEKTKRIEDLNFNRVYAVEAGLYDASVVDRLEDQKAEEKLEEFRTTLNLKRGMDYVVIRTGDDVDFPETLVSFPSAESAATGKGGLGVMVALIVVGLTWVQRL